MYQHHYFNNRINNHQDFLFTAVAKLNDKGEYERFIFILKDNDISFIFLAKVLDEFINNTEINLDEDDVKSILSQLMPMRKSNPDEE